MVPTGAISHLSIINMIKVGLVSLDLRSIVRVIDAALASPNIERRLGGPRLIFGFAGALYIIHSQNSEPLGKCIKRKREL